MVTDSDGRPLAGPGQAEWQKVSELKRRAPAGGDRFRLVASPTESLREGRVQTTFPYGFRPRAHLARSAPPPVSCRNVDHSLSPMTCKKARPRLRSGGPPGWYGVTDRHPLRPVL